MSIQRLAREVKEIALTYGLSDAVVREALAQLKAVGSAGGAVDAAIEQLVHRARVAKKYPDLARDPQHVKLIKTRLLQMGFGAHELKNLVPSGGTKPASVPTKSSAAPAKPRPMPTKGTSAPAKPRTAPTKSTARAPARSSADAIRARKQAINQKLRAEEQGSRTKSTARASAPTAPQSALDRKKAINTRLRAEENNSTSVLREAMAQCDAQLSVHVAAENARK